MGVSGIFKVGIGFPPGTFERYKGGGSSPGPVRGQGRLDPPGTLQSKGG